MTAKIKLNAASGGGSFSLQAPSSSSNNRVITLPDLADGTLLTSQSSLDSTKLSPAVAGNIIFAEAHLRGNNGNPTVTRSTGFGSFTDNGTGDFTLALSSAQADNDYTCVGSAGYLNNGNVCAIVVFERQGSSGNERANTTTAVNFGTCTPNNGSAADTTGNFYIALMRG
tara:strand:+ start:104 stop:613 length:510 start_codon:yes stop_codon:yes gene_type:complete